MYGLIDCNNFFVSCERVFRPDLVERPVVVLSNGDGCAVAMSNEAKALGIKRGVPVYQVRQLIKAHNVTTLPGNLRLYGDMSSRVMATIASIVPEIEIYSIDECFINFSEYHSDDIVGLGRQIVKSVRRNVGIPTSLGIASSKTLAKVAARFAKKFPGYRGVCIIDTDEKRRKALEMTEVTEIWGVGRRLGKRLREVGIESALQLADLSQSRVRQIMNSVVGERLWMELNGIACIEEEPDDDLQKQMCYTRTFTEMIDDFDGLRRAITSFCDSLGRRLRKKKLCAASLGLFIQTNAYRTELPQYYGNTHIRLDEATNDTLMLTREAVKMLYGVYRKGFSYKRAGVMITEIIPDYAIQQNLFRSAKDRERRNKLMKIVDEINLHNIPVNAIHPASMAYPIDFKPTVSRNISEPKKPAIISIIKPERSNTRNDGTVSLQSATTILLQ